MQRFYWLDDGVAGSSRPGGGGNALSLGADLDWLREHGIDAILTLTETPLTEELVAERGFEALHLPVRDMTALSPDQLMAALTFIDRHRSASRGVVVHCLMGQGRTGMVLAAYLIRGGSPPDEAIAHLRTICPGAIVAPSQEAALHAYARRRDWVL